MRIYLNNKFHFIITILLTLCCYLSKNFTVLSVPFCSLCIKKDTHLVAQYFGNLLDKKICRSRVSVKGWHAKCCPLRAAFGNGTERAARRVPMSSKLIRIVLITLCI